MRKETLNAKTKEDNEARVARERSSKRSTEDQLLRWKDMEVYDAEEHHSQRRRGDDDGERGKDRGTGQIRPQPVTNTLSRRGDEEEDGGQDRVVVQRRVLPGSEGIRMHIRGNGGQREEEEDSFQKATALADALELEAVKA